MRAHVVVIGAGYAGAMAAKRLHQMIAAGYDATVSFDRRYRVRHTESSER